MRFRCHDSRPRRRAWCPSASDRENYYGYASDFEEIKGTMFTARFEHDFNDNVSIRNTTRYGQLEQFYVLTGVNARDVTGPDPGPVDRRRARVRASSRKTRCMTNQTNLTIESSRPAA